jgi:hypothetical protein
VVDITNPTRQSILGKYFIGQTEDLMIGGPDNAWGGLINPKNSGLNIFFDIFTITNFSERTFTAEIWLNPKMPGKRSTSSLVTASNHTITPLPKSKVFLQFASTHESPTGGVNIFDRIVAPNSTLVSDSHKGLIIIAPGGSFIVFMKSPGSTRVQGKIVFTWWEEKV